MQEKDIWNIFIQVSIFHYYLDREGVESITRHEDIPQRPQVGKCFHEQRRNSQARGHERLQSGQANLTLHLNWHSLLRKPRGLEGLTLRLEI